MRKHILSNFCRKTTESVAPTIMTKSMETVDADMLFAKIDGVLDPTRSTEAVELSDVDSFVA